ncbi:DUF5999 family protein [Streptomyces lydicus]|uniref:DUF5999 family protein n=1 Tax=Streptomyces lydicus TaxID=47763 RepID=UPI0036E77EFC
MTLCPHRLPCRSAESTDNRAIHAFARQCEQGFGPVRGHLLFLVDAEELLPNGVISAPRRSTA